MAGPAPAVAALRNAVRAALTDLEAGALVLVACSGGPDSLALAAATAHVAPRAGLRWGAVTVDHGLQPGSADRATATAACLRALGADPADLVPVAVAGPGGPEAAARAARYAALDAAATRHGAAAVLLGHTLDDQAETVLLGLARGAGARSLAGMPARRGAYRRPLLGVPRATTAQACRDAGLDAWQDPHNTDARYARARVRADVLPVLEAALGPGVAAALARTADLLRDDADALDALAAAVPDPADVTALAALPRAVRTRVLRAAALAAGCPASDLRAEHVAAVDALVTDWHGQGPLPLPGGVRVSRAGRRLAFGA